MNEPTPMAIAAQAKYPVGSRVRLYDGRSGIVTRPAKDIYQDFGKIIRDTYLGVMVAVQADGKSYDVWYGINQVTKEDGND